jgi:hypothetical protein
MRFRLGCLSGLVNGTNGTNAAQTAGGHSRNARFSQWKLEAPPGFEPGMEVLQTSRAAWIAPESAYFLRILPTDSAQIRPTPPPMVSAMVSAEVELMVGRLTFAESGLVHREARRLRDSKQWQGRSWKIESSERRLNELAPVWPSVIWRIHTSEFLDRLGVQFRFAVDLIEQFCGRTEIKGRSLLLDSLSR